MLFRLVPKVSVRIWPAMLLLLLGLSLPTSDVYGKGGQPIQIGLGEVPPETVSIGKPGRGALAHGIPLTSGPYMKTRKGRNYGTSELVDLIRDAVDAVAERFPDSPALHIGDRRAGMGAVQAPCYQKSGRDADVGYYMKKGHSPKDYSVSNHII